MTNKIIDLQTYRIEKSLRENGFEIKTDENKRVKILIKLNDEELL